MATALSTNKNPPGIYRVAVICHCKNLTYVLAKLTFKKAAFCLGLALLRAKIRRFFIIVFWFPAVR
jgi:hypothetical protein